MVPFLLEKIITLKQCAVRIFLKRKAGMLADELISTSQRRTCSLWHHHL
jgi:hypothetical protein